MKKYKKDNRQLFEIIADQLQKHGYEGTSLSTLQSATGLSKSAIYHRFPNGKADLTLKTIEYSLSIFEAEVIAPLLDNQLTVENKIKIFINSISNYYNKGKNSCLLNILALPEDGPISHIIEKSLKKFIGAIADMLIENNITYDKAYMISLEVVSLIQGGLVLSRGLKTTQPFVLNLHQVEELLIAHSGAIRCL